MREWGSISVQTSASFKKNSSVFSIPYGLICTGMENEFALHNPRGATGSQRFRTMVEGLAQKAASGFETTEPT
jgi:hypothetical protein